MHYAHKHAIFTNTVPLTYLMVCCSMAERRKTSEWCINWYVSITHGGDVTGNATAPVGRPWSRYLLLVASVTVYSAWSERWVSLIQMPRRQGKAKVWVQLPQLSLSMRGCQLGGKGERERERACQALAGTGQSCPPGVYEIASRLALNVSAKLIPRV